MEKKFIKVNRIFTKTREYGWLVTVVVAIGGLFEAKLGLLVLLIMAGLIVRSFFDGRYWCGNICPHGSLFDKILLPISRFRTLPKFLRSKYMVVGFFIFFVYNFSRKVFKILAYWEIYGFLDKLGLLFSHTYLMVLIVGGGLAISINPRTWCQFCPMGSLQKISSGLGKKFKVIRQGEKKLTILDKEKCYNCGKCSKVCPFQLEPYLNFSSKNQFHDKNCIKCSTCVESCPPKILYFASEDQILSGENKVKNI